MEFPTIEIAAMQRIISCRRPAGQASSLFGQARRTRFAWVLVQAWLASRNGRVLKRECGGLRYCEVNFPLRERLI
jgi:hypothetical protein